VGLSKAVPLDFKMRPQMMVLAQVALFFLVSLVRNVIPLHITSVFHDLGLLNG
jgi:hypothetical protein